MNKGFKIHELEGVECKICFNYVLVFFPIFMLNMNISVKYFCLVSFLDRLNFWDFGGNPDYDLIRTELYKDTQASSIVDLLGTLREKMVIGCISVHCCLIS